VRTLREIVEEKKYDPASIEIWARDHWEKKKLFQPSGVNNPFVIVIPPPNVTGVLHMGHGLNNVIQDLFTRFARINGEDALWVPGTDHAGIATQNVVEKELQKKGKRKEDLGRDEFIKLVWAWKEEHSNSIIQQLRRLGASCDYERERFTMDPEFSRAVRTCFVKLYDDGLIYQGDYIVNWCPRCQTALSDEEAPHKDLAGKLYHIRYPSLDGKTQIIVATTRPETMLGDTAVAFHPDDERYRKLRGQKLKLPLLGREIPLIADSFVDPEFGSGLVKITPAHDPNDYAAGKRHKLEFIIIFNKDGTLKNNCGAYTGLTREEARIRIVEDLRKEGLLEKVEDHPLSAGHCYRCDTIVEPLMSRQWFVKMKPLAKKAIEVVRDKKVEILPSNWEKVYLNWMDNIHDWCISRQIWWGHRIPIYRCENDHVFARVDTADRCEKCGKPLEQDPDVLDTWFSSWLWPFGVLGWPEKTDDLKKYYPTSTLVTDPGILFFWVARMIMAGIYFMKEPPFSKVYFHGVIMDKQGRKMSKSLGNGIDPLDMIRSYGADAVRFGLIYLTQLGQNVLLDENEFKGASRFCNKIWNAFQFTKKNWENAGKPETSTARDTVYLWLMYEYEKARLSCEKNIRNFSLSQYTHVLYDFTWKVFCDWGIELLKPALKDKDKNAASFIRDYLLRIASLLEPVMPFLAEVLYQALEGKGEIMKTRAGAYDLSDSDKKEGEAFAGVVDTVRSIRSLRHTLAIAPGEIIEVKIYSKSDRLQSNGDYIATLGRVKPEFLRELPEKKALAYQKNIYADIFLPLADEKIESEKKRLGREVENLINYGKELENKLGNTNFTKRAPAAFVEKTLTDLKTSKEKLKGVQESLSWLD